MNTSYRIALEPKRQLIRLWLAGQWDEATLAAYERDLATAMKRFEADGGRPGSYLLLVDLREQGVQPKEIAAGQQEIISRHAPTARRRALVMSELALHAMQVRRISSSAEVNMFRTEQEALDWLLS